MKFYCYKLVKKNEELRGNIVVSTRSYLQLFLELESVGYSIAFSQELTKQDLEFFLKNYTKIPHDLTTEEFQKLETFMTKEKP